MPKFMVIISREVTTSDYVERVIDAADIEAAQLIADDMAAGFSTKCPDDYATSDSVSCGGWEAGDVEEDA